MIVKKMPFLRIIAFALLLVGPAAANIAAETALPLPTATPLEASFAGSSDARNSDAGMRLFAMVCGLVAFAAAGQQAFFPRKPSVVRVKVASQD